MFLHEMSRLVLSDYDLHPEENIEVFLIISDYWFSDSIFHLSVESNMYLLWFCVTTLCDWF